MTEVRFIKDGKVEKIRLDQMTKVSYQKDYKGYLFCPNPKCDARVVYASGDINPPHFKTLKVKVKDGEVFNEHIDGCIYSVEHEIEERERIKKDPAFLRLLSPHHIKDILRKAYDKQFNIEEENQENKSSNTNNRTKTKSQLSDKDRAKSAPVAGLATDGATATEEKEREPRVSKRDINNVLEKDYDTVLCVMGFIQEMDFRKRDGYVYLKTNNGKPARILFSEAFAVNNQAQYDGFGVIKRYFEHLKTEEKEVFCCCVGKIIKDDFGTTVLPDHYICFRVNDKDYYGIRRAISDLVI